MLTAKQIMKNTTADRVEKAKSLVVHTTAMGYVVESDGKFYSVSVTSQGKHVEVSCNCPDFCYTWEVALHRKGAARIIHSNGEPPDSRNPSMLAGCCKHIYATLLIRK